MYSTVGCGSVGADRARTAAYAKALRQAVRPGSVVLDIGSGTGILALLACQCGARKVYAIEPGDIIQVAREMAAANGLATRIEFVHELSTRVALPERADLILADPRSSLALSGLETVALADARRRHLAPGGAMVPRGATLSATVAEAPQEYSEYEVPWACNDYGLDLRAGLTLLSNRWKEAWPAPTQLLAPAQPWAQVDYTTVEDPDLRGSVRLAVARPGTGHGVCLWADIELAPGIGLSSAPGAVPSVGGCAFFPWPRPVALAPGDAVTLKLRADLIGGSTIWGWETRIERPGLAAPLAHFGQSTFFGEPLSPARLRRRADRYTPTLSEDGRVDRLILGLMQTGSPLGEIARQVVAQFPDRFPRWEQALGRVGDLSVKYSE